MTKPTRRYDIRRDPDNTWSVYDVFTGVVLSDGINIAFGMQRDLATYLCGVLNDADQRRRHEAERHTSG